MGVDVRLLLLQAGFKVGFGSHLGFGTGVA